jgi:tRNA U38,U39,U40 pseudouridine synthase TruA
LVKRFMPTIVQKTLEKPQFYLIVISISFLSSQVRDMIALTLAMIFAVDLPTNPPI